MLPSYFDYIFVYLRQKVRRRPELGQKLCQLYARIRPEPEPDPKNPSAKLVNARWRPDSVEESRTDSSANSRRLILQFSNCGTLISLAAFVDPIHVNKEKKRLLNAPLPESNAHTELF